MDLDIKEIELIINYIPTLKRFLKNNISFKFFKTPFIENFIFKLTLIYNDEVLIGKIVDKINNDIISNEDIIFSFNYYYELQKNDKLNFNKFLYNSDNQIVNLKLKTNIILFIIKYFQYYYIINELLYDDNTDNDELFYAIYIFSKNEKSNTNKYIKKYMKMNIFFYLIDDLFKIYKKNLDILSKNEILTNINPFKSFLKNIFFNWHSYYKNSLENDSFINIEKKFEIKENFLIKFMCNHNVCS